MSPKLTVVLTLAGGLIVLTVVALAWAERRWTGATDELVERLTREDARSPGASATPAAPTGVLPEPVRRYLALAVPETAPPIRTAYVRHDGEFRTGGDAWKPFTSEQWFTVRPPGFVWDARIRMAPGMTVRVRDSHVGGTGGMLGRLAGLITVVDVRDRPEMDAGTLRRYLAESAWFPTALLPSEQVAWQEAGPDRARVTLRIPDLEVALDVTFDAGGEIREVHADGQLRAVGDAFVPTPWRGRFWDYERVQGFLVPMEGEVAWILPDGPYPYWRGRIVELRFETEEEGGGA